MSDSLQPKNRTLAHVQLLDSAFHAGNPADFLLSLKDTSQTEPISVLFYIAVYTAEMVGAQISNLVGGDPHEIARAALMKYGWHEFVEAADAYPELMLQIANDGARILEVVALDSFAFHLTPKVAA